MAESRPLVEADIELTAVAWAKDNGVLTRKVQWIGRRNAPDRLFARQGRAVFIEFKRPGAQLRPGQAREIERMRDAGLEAYGPVDSFQQFLTIMQPKGRRRVIG